MIKLQRNKKEGDPAFKVWVRKKKRLNMEAVTVFLLKML